MCLFKIERDDSPPPSRRVVIRPVSNEQVTMIRNPSRRSHRSSFIVTEPPSVGYKPAPRPVQYISASTTMSMAPSPGRTSIPRIVQAPTPPRSSERVDVFRVHEGGSPHGSHGSLNSHSSRHSHSRSHSHNHGHSRSRDEVVYVSRSRERLSVGAGDRISRTYLTPTARDNDVVDSYGYVEPGRQTLLLEAGAGRRGTTITSGPRTSRERVVVLGEDGRRRESYRIP